jgi:hypothetical protein
MTGKLQGHGPWVRSMYDVDVIPENDSAAVNSLMATDLVWKKRNSAQMHEAFEGCYVLRTDRDDLDDKQIWNTYVILTHV